MDEFFKYWFSGFESSLDMIDEASRKQIFTVCGKACSNSYTKQIYLNAKNNSKSEEEFINELRKSFPEVEISVKENGLKYDIIYKYCACDLVRKNYVKSKHLCECSKASLLYNWETIFGEGNVEVELVQSILSGASYCHFIVNIK